MGATREEILAQLAAIPKRVQRGQGWFAGLDALYTAHIEPHEIRMWSNRWCPLGQYANAAGFDGVNAPYQLLERAGVDPRDSTFVVEHGFACPARWEDSRNVEFAVLAAYYSGLHEQWVNALTFEPTLMLDMHHPHR